MAAPRQEVLTLPLQPTLRNLLIAAGFRTTADLEGIGPLDLASGTFLAKVSLYLACSKQ